MGLILTTDANPGVATWGDGATSVGTLGVWPGVVSTQNVIVSSQPADGETYTLDVLGTPVVYTFKNTPAAPTDVQIGAAATDTQDNLASAITTNQGSVITVTNLASYPVPLYLALNAVQPTDENAGNRFIDQTDGTGGNLTIRDPFTFGANKGGSLGRAPRNVAPVNYSYTLQTSDVTDGFVVLTISAPGEGSNWSWVDFGVFLFDGALKGGGTVSVATKAFTGTTFIDGIFGASYANVVLTNGGATPYAAGDVVYVTGLIGRPL